MCIVLALGVAYLNRATILAMVAHSRLPHVEPNRPVTFATGPAMPLTGATRSTVQMALAILGKDARLDDIITFTGQLAQVDMRGEGDSDPALQALIETGVLVGNVIAVSECVAMGRRFGLRRGLSERTRVPGTLCRCAADL